MKKIDILLCEGFVVEAWIETSAIKFQALFH